VTHDRRIGSWDRCYDFLNIFSEKIGKKFAFLTQNKAELHMQKFDHNIVFLEKRHFFCRKLSKIAENCGHNIDHWLLVIEKITPKIHVYILKESAATW
jgi:hypothetical protein